MAHRDQKRAKLTSGRPDVTANPIAPDEIHRNERKKKQRASDIVIRVVASANGEFVAWCSCGWSESRKTKRSAFGATRSHYRELHSNFIP